MSELAWKIEALAEKHQRQAFDCGEPKLNDYLQRLAGQHVSRNVSRVYVAAEEERIIGFYTLSSAQIRFAGLPDKLRKGLSPHYPVPAARIGRLAVDVNVQGQGVGDSLLLNALYRCARTAREIGIAAVIVDAKHEQAKAFYLRHEFVPLADQPLSLAIPIKTVIRIFTDTGLWR